jgi:Methyltransferase domain
VSSQFFDRFPRFYETSETSPSRGRLNLRYEAIFAEHSDIYRGARVLDIASHDARWSLAALQTGASSVTGIEAKASLAEHASANLSAYVADPSRFDLVTGDVFDVLAEKHFEVDVVMCLGFLYHTLRYNELLSRIRAIGPRHVVIDTQVAKGQREPMVRLSLDYAGRERDAVADPYTYGDRVLVGWPNVPALTVMAQAYGYQVERFSDWGSLLRDNPSIDGVTDYAEARRVTVVLSPL